MPISYKNKIYTTLGTPTELSGNVVSTTDSAGVPAKDYTVKGKTIVWNQLVKNGNFVDKNNWFPSNGTGSVSNNKYTFTVTGTQTYSSINQYMNKSFFIAGHKYYVAATITPQYSTGEVTVALHNGAGIQQHLWTATASSGKTNFVSTTFTISSNFVSGATDAIRFILYCPQTESAQGDITEISNVWMTDLTKMFGVGNEPETPSEFRAMFPDDYYPYNAGELKSIMPTNIEESGIERFQLLDKNKYPATGVFDGVTYTNNGDGTITLNGTATATTNYNLQSGISVIANHKYFCVYSNIFSGSGAYPLLYTSDPAVFNTGFPMLSGDIITALKDYDKVYFQIKVSNGKTMTNMLVKPQLFDLTQMFGAGNEPATPEEFWQRVPETLYGYNPSAYKSVNIPSSKYFPDGMRSAVSAYDEINFLSQKAIKRIGSVDLGTLNWTYIGTGDNRYFETTGISDIKKVSTTSEMPGLLNVIYTAFAQSNWYLNKPCMFKIQGNTPAFCISDPAYTDAAAFKAAMSGVMLYYELETPVETAITPPLQALPAYKGFTSFSAPNSLMQNGPLSVIYYAEGGANPESGWLTSYKRKLYMGRTIEWNQIIDVSNFTTKTIGGVVASKKANGTIHIFGLASSNTGGRTSWGITASLTANHKYYAYQSYANLVGPFLSLSGQTSKYFIGEFITCDTSGTYFFGYNVQANTQYDTDIRVMLFDLTQMFGAGNEPATPAEFWSYFDHKVYPYNAGETQPLFKISRKSQWGSATATALYVGENIVIPQTVRN